MIKQASIIGKRLTTAKLKRLFHISWGILLIMVLSLFFWFRPMSVNALNYLVWKVSTATQTETGNIDYKAAHIHYVAYGSGDPVLLLHGGSATNSVGFRKYLGWLPRDDASY
jgi:hypothetical protein